MQGLNKLISDKGIGAIEFHNASNLILKKHYDYIYHEHIFYFTLTSLSNVLKKNGLYPFDFFESPISGGSFVLLFKKNNSPKTNRFNLMITREKKLKINSVSNWKKLEKICKNHKKILPLY